LSLLKALILFGLFLIPSTGIVEAREPMKVSDLEQYQWKNRLLVIFSPSPEVPAYQALSQELDRNPSGVRERDLLVFHVLEQGPRVLGTQGIGTAKAEDLRQRFGITRGTFAVVLIGKDGTVKLKREGPAALTDIFALIDTMPMRQREMRGE
jgi:hypothetical protein